MDIYNPHYVADPILFDLGVKTIVVGKENRILLMRRSDKVSRPHGWDFPGGGVDKGENPSDAAVREIKEEATLEVRNLQLLTTYIETGSEYDIVIIGYTAQADTHDVKITGWEHESFKWISLKELKDIELPPLHTAILRAYLQLIR